MWVYGTSGDLVKLEPEKLPIELGKKLPPPKEGVFYAVNRDLRKIIRSDPNLTAYADRLVKPTIHGKGRDGEEIYHFTKDGMNVALITENYGKSGQIIMDRKSNEKYKVRLV